MLNLPYVYNIENWKEMAVELLKLQINENTRLITIVIKDRYVNLPIPGIMQTASYWRNKHNLHNKQLNEQVLDMINAIVKQNYY
jgi:stalled ribosome rescue protein Dom34